jgi:hypothetical protein
VEINLWEKMADLVKNLVMWMELICTVRKMCLLVHTFKLKQLTHGEVINLTALCNVIVTNMAASLCKLCA